MENSVTKTKQAYIELELALERQLKQSQKELKGWQDRLVYTEEDAIADADMYIESTGYNEFMQDVYDRLMATHDFNQAVRHGIIKGEKALEEQDNSAYEIVSEEKTSMKNRTKIIMNQGVISAYIVFTVIIDDIMQDNFAVSKPIDELRKLYKESKL